VRFGLTATPLISWHKADDPRISSEGVRAGFQYGLLVDALLNGEGRYIFSTGAVVTMTGGNLNTTTDVFSISDQNSLQYFEIPLTLKLVATELNYFRFWGQFGLVPGVNIRARGDRDVSPDQVDISDAINRRISEIMLVDIGLQVGAGAMYELAEHLHLSGGIIYRNGFVNNYDDGDGNKITLNHLALQIGIFF
jgi:hypothetical protein